MNITATKCYKVLKFIVSSAIILYRKVAGLIMQGLKSFWDNWNWVLPVGAFVLSAFTWYYKTSTETPARIDNCEKHLQEHVEKSQADIQELKSHINNIDLLVMEVKTTLKSIDADLTIIKSWILEKKY